MFTVSGLGLMAGESVIREIDTPAPEYNPYITPL